MRDGPGQVEDPQADEPKKRSILTNVKAIYAIKPVFKNTAILCMVWGTSIFSFYFIEFYTKLVPTNNIYIL